MKDLELSKKKAMKSIIEGVEADGLELMDKPKKPIYKKVDY